MTNFDKMTVKDESSYELFKTTPKDPRGKLVEIVRGLKKAKQRAAYLSRGHRNDSVNMSSGPNLLWVTRGSVSGGSPR